VAPIDAWDLGVYPDKSLTRYVLPFQWILPHLEFDAAVSAIGKAFCNRLRTLAETLAGESVLEQDLLQNGPCEFWLFDNWLVVKAADGQRVALKAAKNFSCKVLRTPLLAVLSSIRGGSKWGAFISAPLPASCKIPQGVEYAAGRRSFFHEDAQVLLSFLRQCAAQNALQVPFTSVE
jgi:hypothetical protein